MASSKMTLIGMNIFMINMNDDLFKNLTVPEGLNKQTLTDNILLRGGEFEVSYPDPTATQNLIGIWSSKMQPTFERWVNALIHAVPRGRRRQPPRGSRGSSAGYSVRSPRPAHTCSRRRSPACLPPGSGGSAADR